MVFGLGKRSGAKVAGVVAEGASRKTRYIEATISKEYADGRVDVLFDARYVIVVNTDKGYLPEPVLKRLGVDGNSQRIGMGIRGLHKVPGVWAEQYAGTNGKLKIPEKPVQEYIVRKIGLQSATMVLGGDGSTGTADLEDVLGETVLAVGDPEVDASNQRMDGTDLSALARGKVVPKETKKK